MADPITDNIVIAVVVLVIVLAVLTFIELKYLRKAMQGKRMRAAKEGDLPDRAHNAILTTKAIRETLAASGVVAPQVDDLVQEAEAAYRGRNYRVAIDIADRAKSILKEAKARQDKLGDLAKLRRTTPSGPDEATTKELLQKELPPNYAQAKFTIALAEERIAVARTEGRATDAAEALLVAARTEFDRKEFDAALKSAVRSRRSADGEPEAPAPQAGAPAAPGAVPAAVEIPRPLGRQCASCGSELLSGDTFCRKCGVAVQRPTACAKCGASLKEDDGFCRKCGTPVG